MDALTTTTLAFWTPGPIEIIVILVLGVLLFGRRLPEVGRSLGKSIVEFKRGIKDINDDVESASDEPAAHDKQKKTLPETPDNTVSRTPSAPAEQQARPDADGGSNPTPGPLNT